MDGRLDATDARGQGIVELSSVVELSSIVELSSARRDCNVLAYYARMDSERLHVWKRLVKLIKSDFDEESEPAAWCTHQLTLLFEDVNDADAGVDLFTSRPIMPRLRRQGGIKQCCYPSVCPSVCLSLGLSHARSSNVAS